MVLLSHALNAGVSNSSLKGIFLISSVFIGYRRIISLFAMKIYRMNEEICYEDFTDLSDAQVYPRTADAKTRLK